MFLVLVRISNNNNSDKEKDNINNAWWLINTIYINVIGEDNNDKINNVTTVLEIIKKKN